MVPNISQPGTSFHGALKYYAHDKRAAKDQPHPTTSDRVAWQEVRNLTPGISAKAVAKIMGATARDADNLKQAAGKSARGRKADDRNVYSYSLSWEPSERPDKAEMLRAADETLKALGADDRQAVIICHTDREHSHVHVVLNLVSPIDGTKLNRDKDADKLSKWARDYERYTGRIVTPERHKKWEAREQHPDPAARRAHIDKVKVAAQERAHDLQTQAQRLRDLGVAQQEAHKEQARALNERDNSGWRKICDDSSVKIRDVVRQHQEECQPIWAKHALERRELRYLFAHRERTLGGLYRNARTAAQLQRSLGHLDGRSMMAATVRNWFSSHARAKAFEDADRASTRELVHRLRSVLDAEVQPLKAQRDRALAEHTERHTRDRSALDQTVGRRPGAWRTLAQQEKAGRRQIYLEHGDRIAGVYARHHDECRPIWSRHFIEEARAERAYKANEKTIGGQMRNAWQATMIQSEAGELAGRSVFTATVKNFFSSQARFDAFEKGAEFSKARLSTQLKAVRQQQIDAIKAERSRQLEQHRKIFDNERGQLVERQAGEKAKLRDAWAAIRPESRDGAKPFRDRRNPDRAARIQAARERKQGVGQAGLDRATPRHIGRSQEAQPTVSANDKKASFFAAKERVEARKQPQPRMYQVRADRTGEISAEHRRQMVDAAKGQPRKIGDRSAATEQERKEIAERLDRENQHKRPNPKPGYER